MKKLIAIAISGLLSLCFALTGVSLANAEVERTGNGVHHRLLLPMGPLGKMGFPFYSGSGDWPVLSGFLDGPIVSLAANGAWNARWFCQDRVERAHGTGNTLRIECAGRSHAFTLTPAAPSDLDQVPMTPKVLVLSDIEGNLAYLDATLRKLDVVDDAGNWRFGANRLVIAGDAVDRGRDVFAVLWRLHGLAQQAQQAGGALHMLLGNHEQYLLRGNVSRAHPEHLFALGQMGGADAAFAADTVIGGWLRSQPVVLKVGSVLFTHGGISGELARQGLSVAQLNAAMRGYWRGEHISTALLDAVLGPQGVTQYRGYFKASDDQWEQASDAAVTATLRAFGASKIVVGHTIVDQVSPSYRDQVYAIDVNSNAATPQVLLFEHGIARIVDTGIGRQLPGKPPSPLVRPIALSTADDWQMLAGLAKANYRLMRLPHPY